MCYNTHWGSAVSRFLECIGVVRFYGEGDPVGIPGQRNLHFVDVEWEEAWRLLAATFKPSPSVGIETSRPVLLKLVWTSSVERLLAATDETRLDLVWNYTAHPWHICSAAGFIENTQTLILGQKPSYGCWSPFGTGRTDWRRMGFPLSWFPLHRDDVSGSRGRSSMTWTGGGRPGQSGLRWAERLSEMRGGVVSQKYFQVVDIPVMSLHPPPVRGSK